MVKNLNKAKTDQSKGYKAYQLRRYEDVLLNSVSLQVVLNVSSYDPSS